MGVAYCVGRPRIAAQRMLRTTFWCGLLIQMQLFSQDDDDDDGEEEGEEAGLPKRGGSKKARRSNTAGDEEAAEEDNEDNEDNEAYPAGWPHPAEDRFMKLSEMERFLLDAEAKAAQGGDEGSDSEGEEDEDEDDEGGEMSGLSLAWGFACLHLSGFLLWDSRLSGARGRWISIPEILDPEPWHL